MDELLEIRVDAQPEHVVVQLRGELDASNAPRLWEALDRLPPTPSVTFELGELRFMDVAGLRPIVTLAVRRTVRLRRPRPVVNRLLGVLDESRFLIVEPADGAELTGHEPGGEW